MLCVHIYIFNRKISATFDSEKQYSVIQEAKDNMKKHLLCLITTILIAASLNAQPNYNYEKLQREDLGRGVVAIARMRLPSPYLGDTSRPTPWIPGSTYIVMAKR